MRLTILLLFAAAFLPAQLRLSYDLAAAPDRLTVLTMNDAAFYGALDQFYKGPSAVDLTPILPVVLMIKNTGQRKIGFLSVRYTYTLPDGDHSGDVTYARNPILGDQFLPGEQILVYPGVGMFSHNRTGADPTMVRQTADLLQKCSAVGVSIDAVTWDDGEIRGVDRAGIGRRYQAERAAIADALAGSNGHLISTDERFSHTRARVSGYSAEALKEMLEKFAPLKGVSE